MSPEDAAEALKLDESRFSGEGAELSLLHALRKAEIAIETGSSDILLPELQSLHAFFLKLLLPVPSPSLPRPGRPIRHLVTRCLVKLHKKVESRSLFDFVQALLKGVGDGGGKNMSQGENVMRVAAWFVIGEVIKELGANMMSFMAEICSSSVKILRNGNLPIMLRTHAVQAFSKSLQSAGRALPDSLVKDLFKALRSGLQDKALPIQRACADTFLALNQYTAAAPLQYTLDQVGPLVLKALDTADHATRRSLNRLLAHLLARTQEPGSGMPPVDAKKAAKKDEEADPNEPSVITSAPEDRTGRTLLSTQDMLKYLSVTYNKPATTRKQRNGIVDLYSSLLTTLGTAYVEAHYAEIVKHMVDELVLPGRATTNRYEILSIRDHVGILLRDLIAVRLLTEGGQVMAIREWSNNYLKKWSLTPLPGTQNAHKNAIIVALREVAGLLEQIGNVPPSILELLAEPLVRLLSHESYSVRVAAAYTMRRFCDINPSQLPRMLSILLIDIEKELSMLGTPTAPKELPQRVIGKTFALSALIAAAPSRPLYVSHDLPTKVFDLAVSLLKKAGDHDIPRSTVEVQVAWYLIAGLMSLGPGFVKMHLPQLLVLWRNALPKPTSKDTSVGERGEAEWAYLLLVRECTLAAVLNFLRHNASLVNIDVGRRLATLFTNTLNYVNGFATAYAEALREQAAATQPSATPIFTARPSLVEREANLRRRVLQCFTSLGPGSATETMQPALLQAGVTVFADPENYSGSAAQAAIAAQTGQFQGIWSATDGYAFGVTSLLGAREVEAAEREEGFLNRDRIEVDIESQLSHPILGSLEHDVLDLLTSSPLSTPPRPSPAQTGVIDAGVNLFARMLPHQNVEGMVQSLATLSSHVRSSKLEKNPGRKQAVVANVMAALRRSLGNVDTAGSRAKKVLGSAQVSDLIRNLLQDAVLDPQPSIRQAAAETMGLLSSIAGSNYLSSQVQWLVDQVVNNRIPDSRAGCALAFGAIYSSVGGLAGGPILKTIVNILMSLATDPHPVVHFWSMVALAQVINAANLSYEPFVTNTLGMLSSIYLLDTHEPSGGSAASVNIRGDLPAYQVMCRILHALIGVIGPELQEPGKIRSLVFLLVHEFGEESDEGLAVEAIKCVQQFLMFAPSEVNVPQLLDKFRVLLASPRRPLKGATITALYQIVQRDAVLISKIGGNQLVEDLFGLLDDDPSLEGVKNVIIAWLQQTAAALPSGWIDLCQRIMTRTAAAAQKAQRSHTAGPQFVDDEGESFAGDASANTTGLSSRWRTQLFALQCLHNIVLAVAEGSRLEHFDPNLARNMGLNNRQMLFSRVADLIRMAFSASAALVMEVRIQGLIVLQDVIQRFAQSADPDFEGALLLEQHQAPIAAALTPSFGQDSAPEVLALAVQVCAVFVGSGVVKEVGRMGRILKLLTGALEQCKDGSSLSLGDADNLSSNATVMLKISILAAWAELHIASLRQVYLDEVTKPYRWLLGPFWIGVLRDYANLRTDPEMGMGMAGGDLAQGTGRDVLLPYYEKSVPKLLHAVAISLSASDVFAIGAMDGQTYTGPSQSAGLPAVRPEPCANFYIIYGLAFETLVKSMGDSSTAAMAAVALKAMASLVQPQLSGTTVFDGAFFDELCTVAYRIGMSEPAIVKTEMLGVMSAFVTSRKGIMGADQAQTRRALAVVTYTLRQVIPSREVPTSFLPSDTAVDRVNCLRAGFSAFTRIVESIDAAQRADLAAIGVHLFGDMLHDESAMDLCGACLPSLKASVDQCVIAKGETGEKVVHGLLSSCMTNVDEMRTRLGAVANLKIKNNLLATTLILTTLSPATKVSKPLIEQIGLYLTRSIASSAERPELGLTPIHCASTFLSASHRPTGPNGEINPILSHLALHVLPGLVEYLAESVVASASGDRAVAPDGVKEVVKALVTWTSGLSQELRPRGYAVLLPSLALLLDQNSSQPSALHLIATTTLLGLAQSNPAAFKDATMAMEEAERGRLERGIRDAVGGGAGAGAAKALGAEKKGGIELKSFG